MDRFKVLIIEDDKTANEQLAKVVKKEGFEVIAAMNGKEGLKRFTEEKPDIVITDLKMPEMDGMEVMHTIKSSSPEMPLIVITAFGETDTVISAIREGALDYLKKPLDIDQLSIALGRAKEKVSELKKTIPYPTLLLAEDEKATRERLARILENEGWEVFQASNGEEAIELFQRHKIDVVLLDIKMPKKDGLQTLHEMRNLTDDFEAVILTGYGDESNAIQALRDGAINFLRKPIDLDQMIIAVEKANEKLSTSRALRFRTRELILSREIIAKITAEKQIVVDVREHILKQEATHYAQSLLEAIPVSMVVINRDMCITYINSNLKGALGYSPEDIDETFMAKLKKIGINNISKDTIIEISKKLFDAEEGSIEKIYTSKYAYLILTKITIIDMGRIDDVVLIALRGERAMAN